MDLFEVTHRAIGHTLTGQPIERLSRMNGAGWSPLHVLEHIRLFEAFLARLYVDAGTTPRIEATPAPDLSLALVRTRKLRAPEVVSPAQPAASAEEGLAAIGATLELLRSAYAAVPEDMLDGHGMSHPAFGPLTLRQWYDLGALHVLRHMAQIEEMVGASQA